LGGYREARIVLLVSADRSWLFAVPDSTYIVTIDRRAATVERHVGGMRAGDGSALATDLRRSEDRVGT